MNDDPIFGPLMAEISADMAPFKSQIADATMVKCALALARQKRVAAANARLQRGFIDGIGEVVASIDADLYHYLAFRHGYAALRDPDFLRILLRDNEDIRVKCVSRRSFIVVPARSGAFPSAGAAETAAIADVCTEPAEIDSGEMAECFGGKPADKPGAWESAAPCAP